jgi:phage-related protein
MTDIIDTVQLQSIDDSIVDLFEITINGDTSPSLFLTSGMDANLKNLYFPYVDENENTTLKEYVAIPIQMEGIDLSSEGPSNRPKLVVANLINLGRAFSNGGSPAGEEDEDTWKNLLQDNNISKPEDICGSSIVHRTTLLKNTFRAGDSIISAKEFPKKKYILDRVTQETNVSITYELVAPFDLEKVTIPARVVIGRYCPWKYQGVATDGDERSGCTWGNGPDQSKFFDIDDDEITGITTYSSSTSYSLGAKVKYPTTGFVKIWQAVYSSQNKLPSEGSRYWKRIDLCGKTLSSCKVRFNKDGNRLIPLPFGGFPGTRKLG